MIRLAIVSFTVLLAACGGSDDPFADADPRCAATCAIEEPEVEGAFDVCSLDSAASCIEQCEVRIAGVETVCASCLLEGAYFGSDSDLVNLNCDANGRCTVTGHGGTCTYQDGNMGEWVDCMRVAFPRREVACQVDFDPVADCAAVCGG